MKKQVNTLTKIAALALLAVAATPAMAQKAGDIVTNIGWFHLAPQEKSETLKISGHEVPGSGAKVSDADTLGLQLNYFVTDNWVISGDGGLPPKFKLDGDGTLAGTYVGSAKQWSPAIVAKYFFGDANSKFRPFVGLGATYVWYSNVELSDAFQQKLSNQITAAGGRPFGGLKSSAKLSKSFAPVLAIGGVYNIDAHWSVGASLSYVPLKTKADITTELPNGGRVSSSTKLTLNPLVSFLSVGYKF